MGRGPLRPDRGDDRGDARRGRRARRARPGRPPSRVGCGTGGVAERAADAGADVLGVDIAPDLVEIARRRAEACGLSVRYEVGDAESLPVGDGEFDVVTSAVGVMFAPDQQRAAQELARACRSGGRLVLASWRPEGGAGDFFRAVAPFQPPPPEGLPSPLEWGREAHVETLLGDAFDLRHEERDVPFVMESADAAWELFSTSFGPLVTLLRNVEPALVPDVRRAFFEHLGVADDDEPVNQSRTYLLTVGTRR